MKTDHNNEMQLIQKKVQLIILPKFKNCFA